MNMSEQKRANTIEDVKRVYSLLIADIMAEEITLKTYSARLAPLLEGIFIPPNYLLYPTIKVKRKIGGKSLSAKGRSPQFFLSTEAFLEDENIINIRRELVVVAHEFGHYISFRKGKTKRPGFDESLDKMHHQEIHLMTDYQKNLILDEEISAWTEAKEVLIGKDYQDWPSFESLKEESLNSYRSFLKVKAVETNDWFGNPDEKNTVKFKETKEGSKIKVTESGARVEIENASKVTENAARHNQSQIKLSNEIDKNKKKKEKDEDADINKHHLNKKRVYYP